MKSRISNGGDVSTKRGKSQRVTATPTRESITPRIVVPKAKDKVVEFIRNCRDPIAAEAKLNRFVHGHLGTLLFIEEAAGNLYRSKIATASLFDLHSSNVTDQGCKQIKAAARKAWQSYLNTFCIGWEDKPQYWFPSILLNRDVLDFLMDAEAERIFTHRMNVKG